MPPTCLISSHSSPLAVVISAAGCQKLSWPRDSINGTLTPSSSLLCESDSEMASSARPQALLGACAPGHSVCLSVCPATAVCFRSSGSALPGLAGAGWLLAGWVAAGWVAGCWWLAGCWLGGWWVCWTGCCMAGITLHTAAACGVLRQCGHLLAAAAPHAFTFV